MVALDQHKIMYGVMVAQADSNLLDLFILFLGTYILLWGCGILWSWEGRAQWGRGYGEACIASKIAKLTWAFSTKCRRCCLVLSSNQNWFCGFFISIHVNMSSEMSLLAYRDNQWATKTLIGTHQIHCVGFCSKRDQTKLAIRDLSCFCAFCINEDYERCTFLHHARIWKVHFIVPLNPRYIQSVAERANEEDDWEHGGNGNEIVQ